MLLKRLLRPKSDSVIRPGNLLTPNDFTGAPWSATNLTMTGDAITAPDGSKTADLAVPTSTSSALHYLTTVNLTTSAVAYSFRVRAKPAYYRYCEIGIANSGSYTKYCYANFNIQQGSITDKVDVGGYIGTSLIKRLADGWVLLEISAIVDANSTHRVEIYVSSDQSRQKVWSGDTINGIYFWGAEFSPVS